MKLKERVSGKSMFSHRKFDVRKMRADGWTFVETLIVMSIVLVLTSSVGASAIKQIDKAKVVSAKSQVEIICMGLDSYYMDIGRYPSVETGFAELFSNISNEENWNGPYVTKQISKDPWGSEYYYSTPGPDKLPYAVVSYGKDLMEGGTGYDADITSY